MKSWFMNPQRQLSIARTISVVVEFARTPIQGILANSTTPNTTVILWPMLSQISLLAAVDGAVLLDDHLRIQGFGVRFPVLLPPETIVEDALTGSEYSCGQWGLRHQSVLSVCEKCEQAIGLIVSQDGEVKAVKADGGRLMFWDGILD